MSKYAKEMKLVQERLNEVLLPFNHKVEINHQNGYTVIYIIKIDTNTANLLEGGLNDKSAIQYMRAMLEMHRYMNK